MRPKSTNARAPTRVLALALFALLSASPGTPGTASTPAGALGLHAQYLGQSAPEMVVSGPSGEIRLSALRGRVAILHFWATWCESCREELPQLQGLLDGLADQQAVLLSVSIETDKAQPTVEAYARALGYQGEVAVALAGETPEQYWTWGVPVTYFVSRKGTILWRVLGQRDWRGEAGKALLQAVLEDPR